MNFVQVVSIELLVNNRTMLVSIRGEKVKVYSTQSGNQFSRIKIQHILHFYRNGFFVLYSGSFSQKKIKFFFLMKYFSL